MPIQITWKATCMKKTLTTKTPRLQDFLLFFFFVFLSHWSNFRVFLNYVLSGEILLIKPFLGAQTETS